MHSFATTAAGIAAAAATAASAQVVGGEFSVTEQITVTLALLDPDGDVITSDSAQATLHATAFTIVELSTIPVVPDDIFDVQIISGEIAAFELSISDIDISIFDLNATLNDFTYELAGPGTISNQIFGLGQGFFDHFEAPTAHGGSITILDNGAGSSQTIDLASLGFGEIDLFSFYNVQFNGEEFVQNLGIDTFNLNLFEFGGLTLLLEVSLDSGNFSLNGTSRFTDPIPAPSAALMLGLGGLAVARRRR